MSDEGKQIASQDRSHGTETVTVACKMPNGVKLELVEMVDRTEPVMGGGARRFQQARRTGQFFIVRGPAVPFGTPPNFPIIGGYALTHGIPKDFWDKWCSQNKDSPLLENHIIFAHTKADSVRGMAKEHKGQLSGHEPIDPEKPPRFDRRFKVEKANNEDQED